MNKSHLCEISSEEKTSISFLCRKIIIILWFKGVGEEIWLSNYALYIYKLYNDPSAFCLILPLEAPISDFFGVL